MLCLRLYTKESETLVNIVVATFVAVFKPDVSSCPAVSMGIDPESVTYSMVMDRIAELESEKGGLDQEYAKKAKDFKEMEKQMGVMKEYMEKQGIKTRKVARSDKKKDGQER